MNNNGKKSAYIYCIMAMIGWGTMFVACKMAYGAVSGFTLLFIRYFIATCVYMIIYRNRPRPELKGKDKRNIIIIGVLGYLISNGLQMVGTYYTAASLASIINTITPVAMIIFAGFILREKSNVVQISGIGVTIIGAVVIVGASGGGSSLFGVVLNIIGMLLWGLSSVLIRKFCANIDAIWLTIYATVTAMLLDIPIMGMEIYLKGFDIDAVSAMVVIGALWLGTIPTAGANLWWNRALDRLPAATCSMFYAVLPLSTTIFGIILLGESITLKFIIGGIVIIIGVIIAMRGEK